MNNPYRNNIQEIPTLPQSVALEAAARLMPPQYDEFVRAFNQRGQVSTNTRAYWYGMAIAIGERQYEEGKLSQDDYNNKILSLVKLAGNPEKQLQEVKSLPSAVALIAYASLSDKDYDEFVQAFNQPAAVAKERKAHWRKVAFNWGDELFLEGKVTQDDWVFKVLPLMTQIDE